MGGCLGGSLSRFRQTPRDRGDPGCVADEVAGREQVDEATLPLLGYIPKQLKIEGSIIPRVFFRIEEQLQGGMDVYEEGARQWREFFATELKQFLVPDLDPLGQRIIEACLDGADQEDYRRLIPHPMFRDKM